MDAIAEVTDKDPVEIGSYRGLTVTAALTAFGDHRIVFKGSFTYSVDLGESATGNITRIDNALAKLPEHLEEAQAKLADLRRQMEAAKAEAARPFALEEELRAKSARLAELDAELNLGNRGAEQSAA